MTNKGTDFKIRKLLLNFFQEWYSHFQEFLTADGACFVRDGSGLMPREDVARFILEVTENPEKWKRKAVAVAIKCVLNWDLIWICLQSQSFNRYSDEEMAGAMERMKAHMEQYMKKPEWRYLQHELQVCMINIAICTKVKSCIWSLDRKRVYFLSTTGDHF